MLDGTETQKTRENAMFSISFWGADARKSSQSRLDPHVGSGNAQKWDLDAKKHAPGSSPNSKIVTKRVVSAMFYKKRIKASYNGCEKLKVRGEAEEMRKTCENALFWTLV